MSWLNQLSGEDENDYIEVNKKYLEKVEKNSKELETYKKALEMACYEISASSGDTTESLINFYLQKAREE